MSKLRSLISSSLLISVLVGCSSPMPMTPNRGFTPQQPARFQAQSSEYTYIAHKKISFSAGAMASGSVVQRLHKILDFQGFSTEQGQGDTSKNIWANNSSGEKVVFIPYAKNTYMLLVAGPNKSKTQNALNKIYSDARNLMEPIRRGAPALDYFNWKTYTFPSENKKAVAKRFLTILKKDRTFTAFNESLNSDDFPHFLAYTTNRVTGLFFPMGGAKYQFIVFGPKNGGAKATMEKVNSTLNLFMN